MTRFFAAGCAVLLLSAGASAHAEKVCAQGKITAVTYRGYSEHSSDPSVTLRVNGVDVFIGMSKDEAKPRTVISDIRATALTALLSGANVTISTPENTCPAYPKENQVAIAVTAPDPGD